MFIPDLYLDFFPTPDPGVKKAPDLGSGSATLLVSTVKYIVKGGRCWYLFNSAGMAFKLDDRF